MPSMRHAVLILTGLVSVTLLAPLEAADDPTFNGQSMSSWIAMLKEDALPRKRKAAAIALGQIVLDYPATHPTVLAALARSLRKDSHPSVRLQAALILGQQPADRSEHFFIDTVEALRIEKDSDVRRELAVALGRLDRLAFPAIRPLAELLKDPAPATRAKAAEALGRIGGDASTMSPQLMPLLQDANRDVRQAAIFALGRIDPDDREAVSRAVIASMESDRKQSITLNAQSAIASSLLWATQRDHGLWTSALVTLGLLGQKSPEVVRLLVEALHDPAVDLRMRAALAIGKLGSAAQSAEPALIQAFQTDSDKQVRMVALRTFCRAFAGEASKIIPVLVGRVQADPDYEVRVAILEEIGALGPAAKEALPVLREAQSDPQLKVREAALFAIRQVEKPLDRSKP